MLDFRAAMPQERYYDIIHLDHQGRTEFSEKLAAALRDKLTLR